MSIFHDLLILAQTAAPKATSEEPPSWYKYQFLIPALALLVVWMFFLSRNKKTAEQEKLNMLKNLKKGDRIQTIGGILGTVVEAREREIVVKVDESSNTKLRFSRDAIRTIIKDDEPQQGK